MKLSAVWSLDRLIECTTHTLMGGQNVRRPRSTARKPRKICPVRLQDDRINGAVRCYLCVFFQFSQSVRRKIFLSRVFYGLILFLLLGILASFPNFTILLEISSSNSKISALQLDITDSTWTYTVRSRHAFWNFTFFSIVLIWYSLKISGFPDRIIQA